MYIDDYLPVNEEFEDMCGWMYRDTAGNVTTACGLLLEGAAAAQVLPFQAPDFSRPATVAEIVANFEFVKASHPGMAAKYYQIATSPLLTAESMKSLQRMKVMQFDGSLRKDFPGYDSFPDGAKMALLDMEYNLGDAKLRGTYPRFDAAVDARDWLSAAENCGRNVADPAFAARNAWTKQQFMNALGGEVTA